MKIAENITEQLLCDVCNHLISLNHCFIEQFDISVSVEPEQRHLGTLSRICEKEIPSNKKEKETLCDMSLGRVNYTHTVQLLFSLSSILTLFR